MIRLVKLEHRGNVYIGLKTQNRNEICNKIKAIEGIKYSRTYLCWYIPYTRKAYHSLKSLNKPLEIIRPSGTTDKSLSKSAITAIPNKGRSAIPDNDIKKDADIKVKEDLEIQWSGNGFKVKIMYNKNDVTFLKSLAGSWWHNDLKIWIVRSSLSNLEKLQKHFSCFSCEEYRQMYEQIAMVEDPNVLRLYCTPQHVGKVIINLSGHQSDPSRIKCISGRSYDQEKKRWIIPKEDELISDLLSYYNEKGYIIVNKIPKEEKEYKKAIPTCTQKMTYILSKVPPRCHVSITEMIHGMLRMKYGWKTISLYTGKLCCIMEYYNKSNMDEVTAEEVNRYLSTKAKEGMSDSYLNLVYSSVKLYFKGIKHHQSFELEKMKRPRKTSYLPTILSIQEVERMLSSTSNLKHTAILYSLYGGGLRLGELLSLRVQDIHWDRNQILIKNSKGRKDRMVMLSQSLKELLKHYFDTYQPEYWLFEGSKKRLQYSSSSVNKIVKRAAKSANISRRVTPHTIRHCFATQSNGRRLGQQIYPKAIRTQGYQDDTDLYPCY